jgi:hypothetical protein
MQTSETDRQTDRQKRQQREIVIFAAISIGSSPSYRISLLLPLLEINWDRAV